VCIIKLTRSVFKSILSSTGANLIFPIIKLAPVELTAPGTTPQGTSPPHHMDDSSLDQLQVSPPHHNNVGGVCPLSPRPAGQPWSPPVFFCVGLIVESLSRTTLTSQHEWDRKRHSLYIFTSAQSAFCNYSLLAY